MKRSIMLFWIVILIAATACSDEKPSSRGADESRVEESGSPTPSPTITPASTIETETRTREIDGMTEIYIPAGEFLMGADASDSQAYDPEFPQHTVYLDAYWIDEHEVTNAQYALCVTAGACTQPWDTGSYTLTSYYGNSQYADYPVTNVDWYQASAYCAWAGGSLPTEAQWEKAARGTNGQLYPWGNQSPNSNLLNFDKNIVDTTEVCGYPEGNSPYGLCDMAGNVWEWVNDWYDANYYDSSPGSNPQGPASGDYRVALGGSWVSGLQLVRSSYRNYIVPSFWCSGYGFRCVRQP